MLNALMGITLVAFFVGGFRLMTRLDHFLNPKK